MKKIIIFISLVAAVIGFTNCNDNKKEEKSLTREIVFKKQGELSLMKAANDSVIASLDIEIADDDYKTQTGLMYRHSLDKNHGMLFIFKNNEPRSFYMKNTEIPLDIIYFNSDKEVVSIVKNAKPLSEASLPSEGPARYVLEVNAGLTEEWGLEKGDKFSFTRE